MIEWERNRGRGPRDWFTAVVCLGILDLELEAFERQREGFVTRIGVLDSILVEEDMYPTIEAAKKRAVQLLRELGAAMVKAAAEADKEVG